MDFMISEQTQDQVQDREIVPAGKHQMRVIAADEGPNEYKVHETNPMGDCLKLRLEAVGGNYRWIFDDIPKHLAWRAANLADALGIEVVDGRLSLTPDDCRDKVLTVEVSHYTSKAGKTSAVVKRYVPASAAQKAKPAAAPRTRPAVAAAAGDDIPF